MTHYTIRLINTGFQELDKAQYATFRKGAGQIIEHPVFAFLLEGGGRKILVDTGMSDTQQSVTYHHAGRQESGQAIHEQLEQMGIRPDEIETIIFTHLHWDHCYNVRQFSKASLVVSAEEYEFALDPIPPYWTSYEHPNCGLVPPWQGCEFDLVTGEEVIVPGISVFPTPGHSRVIRLSRFKPKPVSVFWRATFSLFARISNRDAERGWPLTPIGRFASFIDLWHSMETTIERADHILLSHDPSQLNGLTFP